MSMKKLLAVFLMLATIVTVGLGDVPYANAATTTKTYVEIVDKDAAVWELEPGKTTSVVIPVKATAIYIYNPTITVSAADESAPFTFSAPKMTTSSLPLGAFAIDLNGTTYINFDITTKENAKIGKYPLTVDIAFEAPVFSEGGSSNEPVTQTLNLTAKVIKEKAPAQLTISNIKYNEDTAAIGNTFDVSFDVKNEGEISALNTYITIDYNSTGVVAGYSVDNIKIGDLKSGESKNITLSMKALATATEGIKNLKAGFDYKDPEGEGHKASKDIYVTVKKTSTAASEDAKLVISSSNVNNEINAGDSYSLKGILKNVGKIKATNVEISILSGTGVTSGIIPNFEPQSLSIDNVAAGKSREFTLPLLVTESAAAGMTELTVQVSYTDGEGNTKTTVTPFYVTVIRAEDTKESSDIVISNVSQSPSAPMVGQKVTLTFEIENRGNKAATNVSVGGEGLASSGFEPFTAQAYEEIGTLEASAKKVVSIDFKVSANAAEGLNTLTLGCKYDDASGNKQTTTTDVYILNVVNDSNSKPKVIVSNFTKDQEELKAGSVFNFTYTLKNTHTSKAAKNIKVTISQADNVFSATQGTNAIYIDRIGPGEEVERTIELKVKSDVTTAAYELEIKLEYEYDDMSKLDQEAGGVTESNKLKLQAIENLRPSIQNLMVGMGDMPMVNMSTSLSFELVNMGKSPLNNVRFSLEGDFILESGDSYYFGSSTPGVPDYIELMVMPSVAGACGGTLVMTFEDSNGEEVVFRHDFSDIYVSEQISYEDPGMIGDPGTPVFNEGESTEGKKDIMPVWLFIVIQVAILVIFVPIVRIIIIKAYKKKLRNRDEEL